MITSGRSAAAGRPAPGSSRVRVRAVIDVAVIVAITLGALWLASRIPGWRGWEQRVFGGQWLVQILAFMVLPLLAVRTLSDTGLHRWASDWAGSGARSRSVSPRSPSQLQGSTASGRARATD